jgi:hypothetical protein
MLAYDQTYAQTLFHFEYSKLKLLIYVFAPTVIKTRENNLTPTPENKLTKINIVSRDAETKMQKKNSHV